MKREIKKKFTGFVQIIEIIITICIICAACIALLALLNQLWSFINHPNDSEAFGLFLAASFNIIIGLEFVKMIIKQTPGSVIEVLLFAISRQLVVEHTSSLDNLLGVLAIAVLFLVYRYLVTPTEDEPFCPNPTKNSDPDNIDTK